jgi:outer membrane protein OmpA-like peptidoglycan-associated protein
MKKLMSYRYGVLAGVFIWCFCISPAWSDIDGSQDHPMLSRFPDTSIIAYKTQNYNASFIPSAPSKSKGFDGGQWVYGKFSWIVYSAPADRSTLEIFRNYEAALVGAGFAIEFTCKKQECGSKFIKHVLSIKGRMVGGSEYWMPNTGRYIAARLKGEQGDVWVSLLVHENSKKTVLVRQEVIEVAPPRQVDASQPISNYFEGAKRVGEKHREYDEARLAAGKVSNKRLEKVLDLEGEVTWRAYSFPRDVSAIEVVHSYRNALKEAGWEQLLYCSADCGSNFIRKVVDLNGNIIGNGERWSQWSGFYLLTKNAQPGKTTHLSLLAYRHPKGHTIARFLKVSSKTLELDQVSVKAEALAREIESTGKVAVYGIYFDTDLAELKPESGPTLNEIARMLELRPQMSLFVDGHTDDQGSDDYNLDLSRRRAVAVVDSLIRDHGIDAARLEARGLGETVPVDSNESESGRTMNRRVELVAREAGG